MRSRRSEAAGNNADCKFVEKNTTCQWHWGTRSGMLADKFIRARELLPVAKYVPGHHSEIRSTALKLWKWVLVIGMSGRFPMKHRANETLRHFLAAFFEKLLYSLDFIVMIKKSITFSLQLHNVIKVIQLKVRSRSDRRRRAFAINCRTQTQFILQAFGRGQDSNQVFVVNGGRGWTRERQCHGQLHTQPTDVAVSSERDGTEGGHGWSTAAASSQVEHRRP